MRRRHRTLRELLAAVRAGPVPGDESCAEDCLEAMFDPERCGAVRCAEREQATVEAERRRWDHPSNPSTTRSSTGR